MIQLSLHLYRQYRSFCADKGVNDREFPDYLKWVRYFLDYCEKYQIAGNDAERTGLYLDKLRQKGQTEERRQQAMMAVSYYLDMVRNGSGRHDSKQQVPADQHADQRSEMSASTHPSHSANKSFYNVAGYQVTSDSPEWDKLIAKLADEIKVRHYSRKTLKTYALWRDNSSVS